VAPQEHYVGLLHRIFQEYLAAKHLARLPLDQVKSYCANTGRKAPWREVTLTLMQLLERQDDVDGLIDELRKPVADYLEEPLQQILLTRVAVADINCSRRKAGELVSQVFSWIEFGRWMPLRLALVREVAVGLESEQVGALVASRVARWFPGRVRWLHDVPAAAAKQPTPETVSDLRIALHNCGNSYEYRGIAEALASFAEQSPELADEFLEILRGPAEPELMGAALHALARGWLTHTALPSLLQAASAASAKELRRVAILARFNRGERSPEIRDALVDFCREGEWPWPWENEIVEALATGWPRNPQLKSGALERIRGTQHSKSWAPTRAIEYLLRGCPGDDAVARMVADQLAQEDRHREFMMSDVHEALLAGFTKHPLLVPAAEAWLEKNAATHYSPLNVAGAVAALLELGRADLVAIQREDGRPLQLSTYSNSRHNWEFVATVVEHWESLAVAVPDIWERFDRSPIIATELAKAGKRAHAPSQTQVFENAVRTGKQLQVEQVRALIELQGRSALLRDLFLGHLRLMVGQNSMMALERAAYAAMASYLADHFRSDEAVGQVMLSVATSSLIHDVGLIALCRGWPDAPPIAASTAKLPTLIEAAEPVTAWLFASQADAALMARYLMSYPDKLMRNHFGEPRDGIAAVRNRLQADQECRNLVFADLQNVTDLNTRIALAKLLAPSMRNDPAFRTWISDQLRGARENSRVICQLAFDVLANASKPVEFALLEAALTRY